MIARLLRILLLTEIALATGVAAALMARAEWSPAAAALAGVALPLSVHVLVVLAGFGLSRRVASEVPSEHRAGIAGAIATVLGEIGTSLLVFQFAMPLLGGRPPVGEHARPWSRGARIPVLLIHGYACNRQVWRPMARWLQSRGHAVAEIDLEPVFGSIDDYAKPISAAIEQFRRDTGAPRVALVCHSMGGLAARAFLRADPNRRDVAAVVTLGTPHRGTALARLGTGVNARQMRPDSEWLASLSRDEARLAADNPRPRFTAVFSHHDNIVAPQAGQDLPGATMVALSRVGHLRLTRDKRVRPAVAQALAQADPTQAS